MCFLIFTSCAKKEEFNGLEKITKRDVLIVGVREDSGPFGHLTEEGYHAGFDIDVAKYIAGKLLGSEKKVKFIKVTSNTRIETITSNQADIVVATMTITPSRAYLVDFSMPYYTTGQTAVVKEESDIYKFSDLKNKTTIVVLGSTAEKNLRRIIPTAKIVGYPNYKEAFNALLDERGEAVCTDDTIISGFLARNEGYRILNNRISSEHYAVAMKKTEDKVLKQSIDNIIKDMQRDGTLRELKKKWELV